jgi:RNA polymerase sigma-70 factor (ECF subfamily)
VAQLSSDAKGRAAQVARTSYGRLIALLAAPTRDISAAEDALSDALEQALVRWPQVGVPENPEAWLLTVARNRQRDRYKSAAYRTSVPLDDTLEHVAGLTGPLIEADEWSDSDAIPDKRLALMFVCAHPAIDPTVRAPLMLQTVLGFSTDQIAQAFAIPAPTMAQRLVRAKRRIRDTGVPFVIPERSTMPGRLTDVLEAIYGTYAIDWQGIEGTHERDSMSGEALYLAETLAELTDGEPEALGLAALICLSLARVTARTDAAGRLIPLPEQDMSRWDTQLIARGEALLMRSHRQANIGRFQLEAAIQSAHCARRVTGATDWSAVRRLYDALITLAPTLGALVSRAAVIGEIDGPDAGIAALDEIDEPAVARFQPAWATRAHLLARAEHPTAAAAAYERAISLTTDAAARDYLRTALSELG